MPSPSAVLRCVIVSPSPVESLQSTPRALRRAFAGARAFGADGPDAYLACGQDLGVEVSESYGDAAAAMNTVAAARADAAHCLVIILMTETPDAAWQVALDQLGMDALSAANKHRLGLLPVALESVCRPWGGQAFCRLQWLSLWELGEAAARASQLAQVALQTAWRLLARKVTAQMKLFLSHAKLDGLPLAQSLLVQIKDMRFGPAHFYDAQHIPPGTDFVEVLREGVQESVLVMLRTDIYDQRPWCVQEAEWAEQFQCPAVVVEARHGLVQPREMLALGGLASVRIPDGNLLRVLNEALREGLRWRLFLRRGELLKDDGLLPAGEATLAVPRVSLSSLGLALQQAAESGAAVTAVLLAENFREALRPVGLRLVQSYYPVASTGTALDYEAGTAIPGTSTLPTPIT